MARIAIAGFQHETNSFAKGQAGMAEFEMADSWPGLLTGPKVLSETQGMNLPIAGFAEAARDAGHELQPILWCAAEPSGPVTDAAFSTITNRILGGIKGADAVYLDLHGAMITDSLDDGEGALLAHIRHRYGPDLPVVISLDLHANLSSEMVALADHIGIFRTYPHLDMAETGARCLAPLETLLAGARPGKSFGRAPYLIQLHAQYTGSAPMAGLYAQAAATGVELAMGFTGADTVHTGPAWIAYGPDAETQVGTMAEAIASAEGDLARPLPDADTAVAQAMSIAAGKPVILADVEDNAGGGGSSDTTGLLRALVRQSTTGVLLGLVHDPAAAMAAHAAGPGAEISLAVGGRSGCTGDAPFEGRFRVAAVSGGEIHYEGAMYGGGVGQIGPSAALRVLETSADVTIVICSIRNQCLDRAHFRHLGLAPEQARIIAVKSTAHFRADFEPIAASVIPLRVPGALASHLVDIPYQNLATGMRLGPRGLPFSRKT